jgi:hypothetical protein
MPARRAVSPIRGAPSPFQTSAKIPAPNEYTLNPSASSNAKFPISAIVGEPRSIFSESQGYRQILTPATTAGKMLLGHAGLLQSAAKFDFGWRIASSAAITPF